MKYKVITVAKVVTAYIVEAESKEEAEEKFDDLDWVSHEELLDHEMDSEEEIIEIIEDGE